MEPRNFGCYKSILRLESARAHEAPPSECLVKRERTEGQHRAARPPRIPRQQQPGHDAKQSKYQSNDPALPVNVWVEEPEHERFSV